jgi:hypothetical protein
MWNGISQKETSEEASNVVIPFHKALHGRWLLSVVTGPEENGGAKSIG